MTDDSGASSTGLTAVFTGAGVSAAAPASLPLGDELRDRVLAVMHRGATAYAPGVVGEEELEELSVPGRKLEQVLGRLWRVVGDDALECLRCLQLDVPNEAHMLCALHLMRGGMQATVNLDRGIELAHDLIARRREPPEHCREALAGPLEKWRELVTQPSALPVVSSRDEFDRWVRAGRPPALLKVHGSLPADRGDFVDAVVEDTEELGGLSDGRRAAVERLGTVERLVITGYGGLDPDVYRPLLGAAGRTRSLWAALRLGEASPVRAACRRHGVEVREGAPRGLATTVLRDLLVSPTPEWPELALDGPSWAERFEVWAVHALSAYPGPAFALAWAWLLADVGDRDRAARLLREIDRRDSSAAVRVRLADVLYDRARDGDRREAFAMYRRLLLVSTLDWPTRAHCLLRIGGIARGRAVRAGGWFAPGHMAAAIAAPAIVLVEERRRGSRADPEVTAAALGTVGQTVLRGSEQLAIVLPKRAWPPLAHLFVWAARQCERCVQASPNGNRRALARSHRLLALGLAALLRGDPPASGWHEELEALGEGYRSAGDLPGAGNCTAALAVIEMSAGRPAEARQRLEAALEDYAEGRANRQPIASGEALVARLARILERHCSSG